MNLIVSVSVAMWLASTPPEVSVASSRPEAEIIAAEKSMWEMWKRRDPGSFAKLLADDFTDVYLSGEIVGKTQLMKGFADTELLGYELGPIRVAPVASLVKVLVYRAHVRGRVRGRELEYDVDVTSVWGVRSGEWKSVFYREGLVPKALPWSSL